MHIDSIDIRGFRNFKDAKINLSKNCLVIGANDIGKTNLLYAIRLLLDKSLSLADLEPSESDFYAFEELDNFEITIGFGGVTEECVISKMRQHVSDDKRLYLRYRAYKETRMFDIYAGRSAETLTLLENQNRYYLQVLNFKFIGSKRDLLNYIRREKRELMQDAKTERKENEIETDERLLSDIETALEQINQNVRELSYIQKATIGINRELRRLSFHHNSQEIIFDTGASSPSQFVENLRLASKTRNPTVNLEVGGDGRNSQIHLALWASRNRHPNDVELEEVVIFGIEEPETHLHPHQQRRLAHYLSENLDSQVIITTHSPQVVASFSPNNIVRLSADAQGSHAACDGVSEVLEDAFFQFAHRTNAISAEAFFASVVFLVEGPSEELFYRALAKNIGINLDQLNITILAVNGVGFTQYVSLLNTLEIHYIIRTDNDILKVPRSDPPRYRFAGLERSVQIYRNFKRRGLEQHEAKRTDELIAHYEPLFVFDDGNYGELHKSAQISVREILSRYGIFIAMNDLEHDLYDAIPEVLQQFYSANNPSDTISAMQSEKAGSMFRFLLEHQAVLANLRSDVLAAPLLYCQEIAIRE